jgi:S-layer protein
MASGGTFELTDEINGASSVAVTSAATGTADVLNIKLTGAAAITNTAALTVADVETINFLTDDTATTITNISHVAELTAAEAKTITVTGDAGLTLTHTGTALTAFNASGVTGGAVTWTAGVLAAASTITGSATRANTITINTDEVISYTGGTGVDTVTAGNGNNTISTLGGADVIDVGAGNNTITAGDGDDEISVGIGMNTLTLGAGADTVNVNRAANTNIYSTITDFALGDSLDFAFSAGITPDDSFGGAITLMGNATFQNYLDTAAALGVGKLAWFQYGGNTFVVADDNGGATFTTGNTGDSVIALTGLIDLSTSGFSATGVLTFA